MKDKEKLTKIVTYFLRLCEATTQMKVTKELVEFYCRHLEDCDPEKVASAFDWLLHLDISKVPSVSDIKDTIDLNYRDPSSVKHNSLPSQVNKQIQKIHKKWDSHGLPDVQD